MTEEEVISASSTQNGTAQGSNPPLKKKRNLPGNPDPEAEVIALSPKTLMATNRFLCEICGKGFQRDQNLQLHKRGHNLPWKLKQRTSKEVRKRVYVCPETTCVHHHASRALGDLTGIKKHFCRKHGEKKWKCDKCSKRYAVQSDWKAHYKTCGTREYKCDCGTIFSRRDSFITHRAFCDALAEETARFTSTSHLNNHAADMNYHFIGSSLGQQHLVQHFPGPMFRSNPGNEQQNIGRGLPLWIAQGNQANSHESIAKNLQEMHQMSNFSHDHPLIHNPPPSSYQMNWDFAKDQFSNNPMINIPTSNVKEVSVPSLFSTDQQQSHDHHQPISATALLQKAAQIGATTTTPDSSNILENFGLKRGRTDEHHDNDISVQDRDKLCGLYSTTNSGTSGLGSDVEISVNNLSALNQMEMYPAKRCRTMQSIDHEIIKGSGEITRDFLGVGMQTICNPSSMNGWM